MKKLLFIFYCITNVLHASDFEFADWLFRNNDFYRSMTEYQRVYFNLKESPEKDYGRLKAAECLFLGSQYKSASLLLNDITTPLFRDRSVWLQVFSLAKLQHYEDAVSKLESQDLTSRAIVKYQSSIYKFLLLSEDQRDFAVLGHNAVYSQKETELPDFLSAPAEHLDLSHIHNFREKSPVIYGFMSSVIPGSGQILLEKYFDGITSFLAISLFVSGAIVSYQYREFALTGIFSTGSFLFYAGGIYGAYHEAKNQNRNNQISLAQYLNTISFHYRFK